MKYTIKFIDNATLSPADGRKILVNFAKGETFTAEKIGEANGLAVYGFQREGIPFSIIPDTMQNKVLLIPSTPDFTTQPAPASQPSPLLDETPLSGLGLTPTSALLVGGLVLLSFYIIFKK